MFVLAAGCAEETSLAASALTALQASKSLYDASVAVPGADVGSDPSRALVLVDESLFAKVSCKHELWLWGIRGKLRRVMQRMHTK